MRCVKALAPLTVAVSALLIFAATAMATTLTSPTGTAHTKEITLSSTGVTWDGPTFSPVTCNKSEIVWKVEQHGAGATVKGFITELYFFDCNFTVIVETSGSLEIHPVKTNGEKVEACTSGYCTGTLTWSGMKMTLKTSIGDCVITTSNTDIGLITPTNDTGGTGKLDIAAHGTGKIPRTGGNFLCGTSVQWTGSYSVTTPDSFWIDS